MVKKCHKDLIIFTDGACTKNGKQDAKAGYGVYFPNNEFQNISEKFTQTPITNQRAELYAIYTALNKSVVELNRYNQIIIYSDSLYSIKSLTEWIKNWEKNGWKTANNKPVQNLDIIRPIYSIIKDNKDRIQFRHVKSHTGGNSFEELGNDHADKLAVKAIQ